MKELTDNEIKKLADEYLAKHDTNVISVETCIKFTLDKARDWMQEHQHTTLREELFKFSLWAEKQGEIETSEQLVNEYLTQTEKR